MTTTPVGCINSVADVFHVAAQPLAALMLILLTGQQRGRPMSFW